jgi:diaminopimelate decarboxylase
MSSEYNTRPLVPEVLVRGGDFAVIRPRPTYEEILAREPLAPWLQGPVDPQISQIVRQPRAERP